MHGMNGRGHSVPAPQSYALRVLRLKATMQFTVRMLVDNGPGIFTHWHKDHGQYCPGPDDCPHCRPHCERFWKGYYAAEVWNPKDQKWWPVVAEITANAERSMRPYFVRGSVWRFIRPPKVSKAKPPLHAHFVEQLDPDSLPPAFPILDVVKTLYNVDQVVFNQVNPQPDLIIVQPTAGAPPAGEEPRKALDPESQERISEMFSKFRARFSTKGAVQ